MAIDFTKEHRITIKGDNYPLYGFVPHPLKAQPAIPAAGIAPEAEAAMRAEAAKGPIDWSGTVEFSCDLTLTVGETYDYTAPGEAAKKILIVAENGHRYRGRVV